MLPILPSIWIACLLFTAIMFLYRSRLTRDEEDQIFLDDSFAQERSAQAAIVDKVNKIQPLRRVFDLDDRRNHGYPVRLLHFRHLQPVQVTLVVQLPVRSIRYSAGRSLPKGVPTGAVSCSPDALNLTPLPAWRGSRRGR